MKRRFKILIGVVVALLITGGLLLLYLNRPIGKVEVTEAIQNHIEHLVDKNDQLSSVLLTIHSEKTGYREQFVAGTQNLKTKKLARTDSPFHSASVGKTMDAVLFGMLVDEGKISFDDRISKYLTPKQLEKLFVVDGVDYSSEVTIEQLLRNTSGVADYFEGPVLRGPTMIEILKQQPDRTFTPDDLLNFSRDNQQAIAPPGQKFNYSDTGYILLGLILEKIEGQTYAEILNNRIFIPLKMTDSYLVFSKPHPDDMLGIYIDKKDYSDKNSLSVSWSGGGVITTMDDLLTFMQAFENGKLVSKNVHSQMTDFKYQYDTGILYGMGMMKFDWSELNFLLGGLDDVYGGMGSTGVWMLYAPESETYYIANFGSLGIAPKSIEELIKITMTYNRLKVE